MQQLKTLAAGLVFASLLVAQPGYVADAPGPGSFATAGASIYVDADDYAGVVRAAGDLRDDVRRVTGSKPSISHDAGARGARAIVVGTLGHSRVIDERARDGKIDTGRIAGKRESFLIQVLPGALVIAAATSAAPSTAFTISPSRWASRPGIGGPTCQSGIVTRCM